MSLLEDVFLQDEANEAEQLERVIEGDEYDERPRSDSDENSEKEDEAEEDKRRVDPTKAKPQRVIRNPRFLLNPARLTGPRGIQVIPDHFKDFKFRGKGHEKEDLDLVLKRLEHWAYRLYPKFQFEDCLKKIEMLGKKRPVMVHLHKIRSDQFMSEETIVQKDSSYEDTPMPEPEEDEFDKLLQQQIELARSTPAPGSSKKPSFDDVLNGDSMRHGFETPKNNRTSLIMPKATSSPSISEEQKERMLRNRRLAEERRLARLKNAANDISENNPNTNNVIPDTENPKEPIIDIVEQTETISEQTNTLTKVADGTDGVGIVRKHNRSNVIDSSSDEDEVVETNVSIVVDVHNTAHKGNTESCDKSMDNDEDITTSKDCNEGENNIEVREANNIEVEEEIMNMDSNFQDTNNATGINVSPQAKDLESNSEHNSSKSNCIDKAVESVDDTNVTENNLQNEDSSMKVDTDDQGTVDAASTTVNNTSIDDTNEDKDSNVEEPEQLNKTTENVSNNSNVNVQVDNTEDVMDIDFSDDF